uniref:Uncharacterized protein n=1 Tax=Arundo donax TaxID=35708 RepID=A0A0A9EJ20_ARUDO
MGNQTKKVISHYAAISFPLCLRYHLTNQTLPKFLQYWFLWVGVLPLDNHQFIILYALYQALSCSLVMPILLLLTSKFFITITSNVLCLCHFII